jgi:hypothetical protein
MVITCEYCGSGVSLGNDGWRSIQKQTMLPINFTDEDKVVAKIRELMDAGLLHRHLEETSTREEMSLSMVPYWIIPVSARTSVVATDVAVEAGEVATTAALLGIMGTAMGGGRGGRGIIGGPLLTGAAMGTVMGPKQTPQKAIQLDSNYNFPIVALKALTEYQPKNYQFNLESRMLFDVSKIPKGIKVLNGDVGEEAAKYQARTLVDQLQSEKAHAQYHMVQKLQTEMDVSEAELLHAPIWFARYDHKGQKIILAMDGNSGSVINSIGL